MTFSETRRTHAGTADQVASEEESAIGLQSQPVAIWSPFDSTAGAAVLLDLLDTDAAGKP